MPVGMLMTNFLNIISHFKPLTDCYPSFTDSLYSLPAFGRIFGQKLKMAKEMKRLIAHLRNVDILMATLLIVAGLILLHADVSQDVIRNILECFPEIFSPIRDLIREVLF